MHSPSSPPLFIRALAACVLAMLALLVIAARMPLYAASKDKGLDILISADAIPSPEGFRPKPGQPIHYLLLLGRDTLGQAVGGVKMPAPQFVERALMAELEKQGFRRTAEGGPVPNIVIVATVGDANFDDGWPSDNPMLDDRLRPYLEQVNIRRTVQSAVFDLSPDKYPTLTEMFFDGPPFTVPRPFPDRERSFVEEEDPFRRISLPVELGDLQKLVVEAALAIRSGEPKRRQDQTAIRTLIGADKVQQAVANRTLGSVEAERIAWSVADNRYFLTLTAYDAKRNEKGGRTLLWRTSMLIDWRVDFTKALPEMLAEAGPMFGTDVAVPGYVNTAEREGRVEIGTSKAVTEKEAGAESSEKTKR